MALGAAISALGALGKAKLWAGPAMASHNAVLRAIGNCLSQVPRGAFELWLGEGNSNEFSEVVALLDSLSVCISSSSSSSSLEEALSLVDSLVHLVTSRCSTSLSVPIKSKGEEAIHKMNICLSAFKLNTHMVALAALNTTTSTTSSGTEQP